MQNRFQLGTAFRPVEYKNLDMLARYEYRFSRNALGQPGLHEQVQMASVQAIYHPASAWWLNGRLAAKTRLDSSPSDEASTRQKAWLLSGRAVYDTNKDWDIGVMVSSLQGSGSGRGTAGRSRQSAYGAEAGYQMRDNLWLSAGFNFRGFNDKDLSTSEYTQRGVYLRLRFKFDEDLLRRSADARP